MITDSLLQAEAGERAYARGAAYFKSGAVTDLIVSNETINARVVGGDEYAVQLWIEGGELGYSCTCPVGDDGIFCKHGVAAGLAWLAGRKAAPADQRGKDDLAGVREWLAKAPREEIERLLLDQARADPAVRSLLNARAARVDASRHLDLKTLKETVNKALSVSGFVDYHGIHRLIQRATPAVALIAGLIEDGRADTARELVHYALKRGIAAYQRIDDSGGGFGELLHDFAELHLRACRAAPPSPATFGKQFFELQMLDDWGLVKFADYAEFLDEAGLKMFRALAEKEWEKVPARGPEERVPFSAVSYYRITSIMEALARAANDTDGLIAVKSRGLSLPYHYLEIAEILAAAGRRDEALAWAERGEKIFPDRPDSRLVEFLADEYARRGRHGDALALAWNQFTHQPALDTYRRLHEVAMRAGIWGEWRAKALAWLREDFLELRQRDRNHRFWMPTGHSLLVEIFLWEGDSDGALVEAKAGGCTQDLWFALARTRENDHPADAAEIYRDRLDDIVKQANNRAYDEAAALVKKVRGLMQRTKQEKEFAAWLEAVGGKHKAKRNFMQRLDKLEKTSR